MSINQPPDKHIRDNLSSINNRVNDHVTFLGRGEVVHWHTQSNNNNDAKYLNFETFLDNEIY